MRTITKAVGPVSVLDADVLVPILSCDLLLTAFDHDLYRPVITPKVFEEIRNNLLRDFQQLDPTSIRRRIADMRSTLALHTRPDTHPGDDVEAINDKDRHVAAAAVASEADIIVTNDRQLQREIASLGRRFEGVSADEFAVRLVTAQRDAIERVIDDRVAKRVSRPVTRAQLIDQFESTFPSFATALRRG